jgi:hypothetical protein
MMKKSSNIVLRLILTLGVLYVSMTLEARAHLAEAQSAETTDVTFESLGYSDRTFEGASDTREYYFSLSPEWQPLPGSYLELHLNYAAFGEWSHMPALLEVRLNGEKLGTTTLDASGGLQSQFEIPPDLLILSSESSYINTLRITLQTQVCEFPHISSLTVQDSSLLHFVYSEKPISLDLALYPQPIYYSYAFEPSQVRFVLPPEPTQAEVRAALMIAARLGRLTYNNVQFNLSFSSDINLGDDLDEHLVVIGQPNRLPLLQEFEWPVSLMERQLALRGEMPSAVVPDQPFSYTLTVENTSQEDKTLVVEDLLPKDAILVSCGDRCEESVPGTIKWQLGRLAAGETASTVVDLRLDARAPLGESQEHTASLFDDDGNLLNVDTLAAEVVTADEGGTVASTAEKSNFMFVLDGRGVAERDGIVQEIVSPWSSRRALIAVTGLGDDALLKAARALSSRSRFPGMLGPFALVQKVEIDPAELTELGEDMSFASLGYEDQTLFAIRFDEFEYTFDLPGEWAVSNDAYLALHFAHGAILANTSSTLEIELNRTFVGSVNLGENATDNWVTIPLPRKTLRAGRNHLYVRLIGSFDPCTTSGDQLWLTIYADSGLHLPHENADLSLDLANYPYPFSDPGDLGEVVFSLSTDPTITEIEGVLRLAAWLGNVSKGSSFVPQVVLGGDPEAESWTGFDMIAAGRPTNNPYVSAVNETLPQPFRPGTDEILQQVDDLIYRLPAGISLGYVQELPSPRDEEQAMLVVTGTTDESVAWALSVLSDDALFWRLAGNLALIRGEEVWTTDTRERTAADVVEFTQALAPQLTLQATVTPTPTVASSAQSPVSATMTSTLPSAPDQATGVSSKVYRPKWLIPLLILSVAVVVASIGLMIRSARA